MKNTCLLFFIACFSTSHTTTAQSDTIFLDDRFNPTPRSIASYYRITAFDGQRKLHKIKDFYLNGKLQMEAYSEQPDADHLVGKATTYLKNGQIESIYEHKTYQTGWVSLYDTAFQMRVKYWVENDKRNGDALFYNAQGKRYARGTYKYDRMFEGDFPDRISGWQANPYTIKTLRAGKAVAQKRYYDNGKMAVQAELGETEAILYAVYFDKKGKKIGACYFEAEDEKSVPITGTHVRFVNDLEFFDKAPALIRDISEYKDGQLLHKRTFDPKGKLLAESTWKDNKPYDGTNLNDQTRKTYQQGVNTGLTTEFNQDLTRILWQTESVNGLREGTTRYFDLDGTVVATGVYQHDEPYSGRIFQNNALCDYENGQKAGTCINMNSKGVVLSTVTWKEGKKQGEATFHRPGATAVKGVYQDDKPWEGDFVGRTDVVERYAAGIKLATITFFPESDIVQKNAAPQNGMVREYDRTGQMILEGELRYGSPFEGQFRSYKEINTYKNKKKHGVATYFDTDDRVIRTENYVHGKLEGDVIWFKDGKEIARCRYESGEPWDGVDLQANGSFSTYKNCRKNGLAKKMDGAAPIYENWVDDSREGESLIVWRQIKNGQFDTTIYKGIYKNNRPWEGYFLDKRTLEQRSKGRKNGVSKTFSDKFGGAIEKEVFFRNDTLDGPMVYVVNKETLKCQFVNGQPFDGFCAEKNNSDKKLVFTLYQEGKKANVQKKYDQEVKTYMEYHDLEYYSGRILAKMPFTYHYYEQGKLSHNITFDGVFLIDTVSITRFQDTSAVTVDKKGKILSKTVYSQPYSSGYTDYFNRKGGVISRAYFKDDEMKNGCYPQTVPEGPGIVFSTAQVCIDSMGTLTVSVTAVGGAFQQIHHFDEPVYLPWPLLLNERFFEDIARKKGSVECLDTATGKQIAVYKIQDKGKTGIQIMEIGHRGYILHRYLNSHVAAESVVVDTIAKVLEQVKRWEGK